MQGSGIVRYRLGCNLVETSPKRLHFALRYAPVHLLDFGIHGLCAVFFMGHTRRVLASNLEQRPDPNRISRGDVARGPEKSMGFRYSTITRSIFEGKLYTRPEQSDARQASTLVLAGGELRRAYPTAGGQAIDGHIRGRCPLQLASIPTTCFSREWSSICPVA